MKKLMVILFGIILCLATCAFFVLKKDICSSFNQIPYDYDKQKYNSELANNNDYLNREARYLLQCRIYPEISSGKYSKNFPYYVKLLRTNANTIRVDNNLTVNSISWLDLIAKSYMFELGYVIATIPDKVTDYNSVMSTPDGEFDILVGKCINSHIEENMEKIIARNFYILEKQGYFSDYRVVDMFAKKVISIMKYFPYQSDMLENILYRVIKYNDDKPQALYTEKSVEYFLKQAYQDYYQEYYDIKKTK